MLSFISVTLCGQSVELLGAFAGLGKATTSFVLTVCLSVRLHGTTCPTLDGFSLNSILEHFSKIGRENSSVIETWQ